MLFVYFLCLNVALCCENLCLSVPVYIYIYIYVFICNPNLSWLIIHRDHQIPIECNVQPCLKCDPVEIL